jgi:hypothetical protein
MLFTDKTISPAIRMDWVNNTNYFYYDYIKTIFIMLCVDSLINAPANK